MPGAEGCAGRCHHTGSEENSSEEEIIPWRVYAWILQIEKIVYATHAYAPIYILNPQLPQIHYVLPARRGGFESPPLTPAGAASMALP
jgi:hypothetical protein